MQIPLKRCLNVFDLILFGIGHMIGAGIYVLTGTVARQTAGPGVVFSYILASLAITLVAMCYAKFRSKIPKIGSAYMYTYVIIGEFWAFFIGWNLVLEQAIGTASIARAWNCAVNVLSGGAIVNGTIIACGSINTPYLSKYPDFLAVAILIVLTIVVAIGLQFNAVVNNILTVTNVIFLSFIILVAFLYAEPNNWINNDQGGALPFRFSGILTGAMCFYAYIGFERITQASEEAKNPGKAVPISTLVTLAIVNFLYVLASLALTLLAPYYLLDVTVPFSVAFSDRALTWMIDIASIGTLIATTTTTLASLYSMSRVTYASAAYFAFIHPKTQMSLVAIIFCGAITMITAAMTDIEELVEMLSAVTLMAFNFLAVDVLVLRYLPRHNCLYPSKCLLIIFIRNPFLFKTGRLDQITKCK